VVFAANLLMDAVVLWLTGRLLALPEQKKLKTARKIAAPMTGAFYATAVQLYPYSLLNHPIAKFACSLVMAAIAYLPKNLCQLLRNTACIYIVSFAVGGAGIGLWYFLRSYQPDLVFRLQTGDRLLLLPAAAIFTGLSLIFFIGRVRNLRKLETIMLDLAIEYAGERINLTGLLDTGHLLSEPLTAGPVICLSCCSLTYKMLQSLMDEGWDSLAKVSYRTLNKSSQLTLFKPEGIWLKKKDQEEWQSLPDGWIGLLPFPLDQENRYQALVPGILVNRLLEPGKEVSKNEGMAEV